jgi:hypothetical protein
MSLLSNTIHHLLEKSETQLGKLIAQAAAIDELNKTLTTVLDTELIPHCRVGCYDSGVLTLFTSSASWATRLRYGVPVILSKLRAIPSWAGLCSIQVKIQKDWQQPLPGLPAENAFPAPQKLSATNAEQIQTLADSLKNQPGMEKLVESLERLMRHQE